MPNLPELMHDESYNSHNASNLIHQLESELKLLEWHKLANDAAIKASIVKNNQLITDNANFKDQTSFQEKCEWVDQIVDEERTKPIVTTHQYVNDFRSKQDADEFGGNRNCERHMQALRKLQTMLHERETMRERRSDYKSWSNANKQRKQDLMSGILPSIGNSKPTSHAAADELILKQVISSNPGMNAVDKLFELEKRISHLESVDTKMMSNTGQKTGSNRLDRRSGRNPVTNRQSQTLSKDYAKSKTDARDMLFNLTSVNDVDDTRQTTMNNNKKKKKMTTMQLKSKTSVDKRMNQVQQQFSRLTGKQSKPLPSLASGKSRIAANQAMNSRQAQANKHYLYKREYQRQHGNMPIRRDVVTSRGDVVRLPPSKHLTQLRQIRREHETRKANLAAKLSSSSVRPGITSKAALRHRSAIMGHAINQPTAASSMAATFGQKKTLPAIGAKPMNNRADEGRDLACSALMDLFNRKSIGPKLPALTLDSRRMGSYA